MFPIINLQQFSNVPSLSFNTMQTTIKDKGHVMKNMVVIEHGFHLTFEH
jgi:hypothetical protein